MPGKVFISHDRQDTSRCAGLLAALDAWGVDYWFDRQEASAEQLSDQVQMALAESTVFLRICTPSTRRSFWMSMELGAFLGLQADDHHQGRDNQRRLVNVILDPGYEREPFDRTTTVLDATDTAHPEWVNALREALGLPPLADSAATAATIYIPPQRGISRRQALGLGVAGAAVLAAAGAGGLVLLSNKGGSPTVHTPTPIPTPPTKDPRLLWNFNADDKIVSPPIVSGGVVYTASNVGTVYALDAANRTLLWSQPLHEVISNAMALANGLLYVRAHTQLYALDITAQGKTKLHSESLFITEPAIEDGRLYIGQSPPEIDSIDPENLDKFLWSALITGNPSSAPAVVGDVAYVATDQSYLEAYSAIKSDTLIWHRKLGGSALHSKPVVANGVVYIGSDDHRFYAFDARTGADHWPKPFESGGAIEATALVAGGIVYFGSGDGVLYALDVATGKLCWSYKTGAQIFNVAPVLDAGVLYIASEDHHVYALDPASGKLLRSYQCAGPILVTPTIVGGILYVGDLAKYVYAFHLT